MRYTKEFKLECIKKYKNRERIIDPPGVKHGDFHRQIIRWLSIYDNLGDVGLNHNKPKLSVQTIVELIKRVEYGESYSQVSLSAGRLPDLLIKWHKIYLQYGIDIFVLLVIIAFLKKILARIAILVQIMETSGKFVLQFCSEKNSDAVLLYY